LTWFRLFSLYFCTLLTCKALATLGKHLMQSTILTSTKVLRRIFCGELYCFHKTRGQLFVPPYPYLLDMFWPEHNTKTYLQLASIIFLKSVETFVFTNSRTVYIEKLSVACDTWSLSTVFCSWLCICSLFQLKCLAIYSVHILCLL